MKTRNLNNMYNDINLLKERVGLYYTQYRKVPIIQEAYTNTSDINDINPNDNDNYYVIDLQSLENVTLNFGKDYQTYRESFNSTLTDLYIINEQSHNIYYVEGVNLDENIYYTIPGDYTKVEVPTVSQVKLSKMNQNVATLEINAVDKGGTIQSIILYVNDSQYKAFEYTGQRQYVDIILPFYEETVCYINVINTNGQSTQSEKITIKNEDTIATATDMKKFATVVNAGETFEGKTIEMINDIDLEGSATNQWTPIGNIENVFAGMFDGKNNVINNIYIDTTNSYQGLFGYNTGMIKNVGINSGTIKAAHFAGGIVGYNVGMIKECYNKIDMHCYGGASFGGLVGKMSTANARISKCYNMGNITGGVASEGGKIGGIAGRVDDNGIVEYCYNTGNITNNTGYRNVRTSGITEGLVVIKSCYNTGNITTIMTSTETYPVAAGIAAQLHGGEIYNCYNIGTTTVETTITQYIRNGGITGYYDANTEINNCYWLSTESPAGVAEKHPSAPDYEAIQIDTEAEMKNIVSRLGSDFKEDTNNINNGYPILVWQED